jgi:hypothetical protein
MRVTKQDVQQLFPTLVDGEPAFKPEIYQVDNMQMFVVIFPTYQLLVSYLTIIGYRPKGTWLLTTAKHSRTTSKQLTQFARDKLIGWIEQEHLEELIKAARGN